MAKRNRKANVVAEAPVAVAEVQVAVTPAETSPVETAVVVTHERFNRAGFDMLMDSLCGDGIVKAVQAEVKPSQNRNHKRQGFLGTAEEMYINGATGEEIIKAIAAIYIGRGKTEDYGMARGKKILGDIHREQSRAKAVAEKVNAEQTGQVAVAV